jgi:hypothetical protein
MQVVIAESDLPRFEVPAIVADHSTVTKGMLWWKRYIPVAVIALEGTSDVFASMCTVAGKVAPFRLRAGFFHPKDRDALPVGSKVMVTMAVSTPAQRERVNAPAFRLDNIHPCT